MKSNLNTILRGVVSRIRQLREQFEESGILEHNSTKGSLREAYLRQFLADFVPHPFEITSGFITDSLGEHISPQLDLIVYDRTSIPGIAMSQFVSVLPIESVRLLIEAKSVLKASHFQQIQGQQSVMRQLRMAWTTESRRYLRTADCPGVPQFVIALDSECSTNSLRDWFDNEPYLTAICVIGRMILVRDALSGKVEVLGTDDHNGEVLHFLSLLQMSSSRSGNSLSESSVLETPDGPLALRPDIGSYLTFDLPPRTTGSEEEQRQG